MINMKKKPRHRIDYNLSYRPSSGAASTTDCTGLAARPILNEAERESLSDIFEFFPEDIVDDKRK